MTSMRNKSAAKKKKALIQRKNWKRELRLAACSCTGLTDDFLRRSFFGMGAEVAVDAGQSLGFLASRVLRWLQERTGKDD